jgi:hypothetical protein
MACFASDLALETSFTWIVFRSWKAPSYYARQVSSRGAVCSAASYDRRSSGHVSCARFKHGERGRSGRRKRTTLDRGRDMPAESRDGTPPSRQQPSRAPRRGGSATTFRGGAVARARRASAGMDEKLSGRKHAPHHEWRTAARADGEGRIGGAGRDRTDDLLIANEALSQLSYSPTEAGSTAPNGPSGTFIPALWEGGL